jgi:hypothetical protein
VHQVGQWLGYLSLSRNVAFFWKLLFVKLCGIKISAVLGVNKRVESTSSYIFSFLAVFVGLFFCFNR